jgi:anaerobic magnesium-protoporphyrin IX monomethyl ester cyclase
MKVCLIEPPKFVSLTNFVSTISMPPLGLAYIAAAIQEGGHDVAVVDAPSSTPRSYHLFNDGVRIRGLTQEQVIEHIPPDSHVNRFGVYERELVGKIRKKITQAFLLMGEGGRLS